MASRAPAESYVKPIKVVDLFSGAGGFTAGFHTFIPEGHENTPFTSVAAVENDKAAASTYAANYPTADVYADDITGWDPGDVSDAEVVLGGPPCQGFSGLGKEDASDPRNLLWQEYKRIVEKVQPKVFVMENVDRFMRSPQFSDLKQEVSSGGLSNYSLRVGILNSANYGVPQARRRVIAIGTRRDLEPVMHPVPTHSRNGHATLNDEGLIPWVPVGKIFERTRRIQLRGIDLPSRPGGDHSPLGLEKAGPYSMRDLHIGRTPEPLSLARYKAIPPGGNRYDLRGQWQTLNGEKVYLSTESWDKHNSGSGDVMGRLHSDRPSVTIRTEFYKPEKGRYLHPTENRPITHYEAALIQEFPKDFLWHGSKVEIARQIGNAVPVGLAAAIARVVYKALRPTSVS